MSLHLLPADTMVQSKEPALMRLDPAMTTLVPAQRPVFPHYFVFATDELLTSLGCKDQDRELIQYGRTWPVEITPEGLRVDTRWNAFQVFFQGRAASNAVFVERLRSGSIHWDLRCPALEGPETILGQFMRHLGEPVGGTPGHRRQHPPVSTLSKDLRGLLDTISDEDLVAFTDRTDTALDLAMHNQLWNCADLLWKRGVRPSAPFLADGRYLQSLIIATHSLQESEVYGFCENHLRPQWLGAWLTRYDALGASLSDKPQLTWRAQELEIKGEKFYPGLVDTPPSFWITRFLNAYDIGNFPSPDQQQHKTRLIERWVDFWTDHGIDLEEVCVQTPGNPDFYRENRVLVGMSQNYNRSDFDSWKELIRLRQQARFLESSTPQAPTVRPSPRL